MGHVWRHKPLLQRRDTRLWECAECRETAFGPEPPRAGVCGGVRPATFADLPCVHRGAARLVKTGPCPSCPATTEVAPCAAQGGALASLTGVRFKEGARRVPTVPCFGCGLRPDRFPGNAG